jgi:hypothetical protein
MATGNKQLYKLNSVIRRNTLSNLLFLNAMINRLLLFISISICFLFACKKNSFITNPGAQVGFSTDTLYFDTVFTSTGSITQQLKIYNQNNQKINLSEIQLMGGSGSAFKININGDPVSQESNIEIDAGDSIYLFVSVYINPTAANLPFILQDSILVSFNGNQKYIQLQAYGQNANFLQNKEITGQISWPNKLPYVITGGILIDSGATLTIQPGCKIYIHQNAPFIINGSLQVQGQPTDSTRVYFLGDRLDYPYASYPGSWPGIFFNGSSRDNLLSSAVISNAYQGIIVTGPSTDNEPKLTLDECIINNIYDAGILATQSSITARNCLVSNCGRNIVLTYGGNYAFTYCTAASYSNNYITHLLPVLTMDDSISGSNSQSSNLNAAFLNCIFWGADGTVVDEVVASPVIGPVFNAGFNNSLWKVTDIPPVTFLNMLDTDPLFDSVNNQSLYYDFHLQPASPAANYGILVPSILFDLDGNPRSVGNKTSLGCYQLQ